jgi:hypothetical protein
MYNMFSTDYYQLIFLFTFESANMVAKAKQKIGSKMVVRRHGNCALGILLKALRDTAILFGNKQNAIAA